MSQPWDQREDETDLWYARFMAYLQQGHGRSVRATYAELKGKDAKSAPRHWYEASSQHDWVRRASAYDSHQTYQQLQEQLALIQTAEARLAAHLLDAVHTLVQVATDPGQPGSARVSAAREIMDRVGLLRKETVEAAPQSEPQEIHITADSDILRTLAGYDDGD